MISAFETELLEGIKASIWPKALNKLEYMKVLSQLFSNWTNNTSYVCVELEQICDFFMFSLHR